MSLASWYLILAKVFTHLRIRRRSAKFLNEFWAASSLEQVENEIATHGATEPFAHLASHAIYARKHHAKYGALKLEESGTTAAFRSEEHTSELQSLMRISYAVFCLKNK